MNRPSWILVLGALAAATSLPLAAEAPAEKVSVKAIDRLGDDGVPEIIQVDSRYYTARFKLAHAGSAESLIYKPLNHELRSEDYYSNRNKLFRDWIRVAEPDPKTGFTRPIGTAEIRDQTEKPATWRVVSKTNDELVIQFERVSAANGEAPWADKILLRRRVTIRNDTSAIGVECVIVNTDTRPRSVLFELYNGVSLGRVKTRCALPGPEGKIVGVDRAEERGSRSIFAPSPAGAWLGGVNEKGLGAAFSVDWADVDSTSITMFKTVGSTYGVSMRRRTIPAGKSITFRYTFMPFTDFGTLDGMSGDLAGGVLVGTKANYLQDVTEAELKAGSAVPLKVFLTAGRGRQVSVAIQCRRLEDGKIVLDEKRSLTLKTAATSTLNAELKLPTDGLYVLSVVADDGKGTVLRMAKGLEVGRTKLSYTASAPAGVKRGRSDASDTTGPARMDRQFRTIDRAHRTPTTVTLRPDAGGTMKAFFLTPADSTLGHVREIAQRMDVRYDYCAMGKIQVPPGEFHPRDVAEFRRKLRAAAPEVLVTLGVDWQAGLKRKLVRELLNWVRDGGGAVIAVEQIEKQPELTAALAEAKEVTGPMPSMAVKGTKVTRYELGKGRVALVHGQWQDWRDRGEGTLLGWRYLRIDGKDVGMPEIRWRGFEYSYIRLAQLARWAARRELGPTVTRISIRDRAVTVHVTNPGKAIRCRGMLMFRCPRWEIVASSEGWIEIPSGSSELAWPVKHRSLPSGPLVAELKLMDGALKTVAFGSTGIRNAGRAMVQIHLGNEPYRPAAKPGSCTIEVAGEAIKGVLDVRVVDRFDRLVRRETFQIAPSDGRVRKEIALDGFSPRSIYHEIVATVYDSEKRDYVLARATADLFLIPAKPPYTDRFALAVADAPERRTLHIQGIIPAVRSAGMTMNSHSYADRVLYRSGGTAAGASSVRPTKGRYDTEGVKAKLDDKRLIMYPPLLPDAEAIKATKYLYQKRVRKFYRRGIRIIRIDDERRMSGDFDFHPQTLAGLRKWLQRRYTGLEALNRTWGTDFASWDKVFPRTRKQLGEAENIAPWLEFRMYIGHVIGEYYMKKPVEWAAEIAPDLSVGEDGIYEPSAVLPVDWSRYAKYYRHTRRYGAQGGMIEELFRSFAPDTQHSPWMGYGMRKISPDRRIAPWRALLNGGRFAWYWAMIDTGYLNYGVCTSDQRVTAGYKVLAAEEFPDLTGGIDRLIIASRFTDDGIGIAYSYPSWVADREALGRRAKEIVEQLGYQHRLVNLADLDNGYPLKDIKLLIVQQAGCVSSDQAKALQRYVRGGGRLLIVGRTGWRDAHGAPHKGGPVLDGLTGVDTSTYTPMAREMLCKGPGRVLRVSVDNGSARVVKADVLAEADVKGAKLPVLTSRQVGEGKVWWLNSDLSGHKPGQPADKAAIEAGGAGAVATSHWAALDRVASEAGIRRRSGLRLAGKPLHGQETWYYRTPSGRSLLIARYLNRAPSGPVTVQLAKAGHVYEMRSGRYHGKTAKFAHPFPAGRVNVFAVLDYKVTGIGATLSAKRFKAGQVVEVACKISTEGAPADLHAIRVDLTGPDGKSLLAHKQVISAPNGQGKVTFPLALSATPGSYTVTFTDAISHRRTTATFTVIAR